MADLSVVSTSYQVEDRSWLLSKHGTEFTPSATFDVSAFTAATHYPNGYLKSGIAVAKLTATRKYVPYVDAGSGGQGVLAGYIFAACKVPNLADLNVDTAGAIVIHGVVSESKLPIANGATGGGFVDANGKADNTNIIYQP